MNSASVSLFPAAPEASIKRVIVVEQTYGKPPAPQGQARGNQGPTVAFCLLFGESGLLLYIKPTGISIVPRYSSGVLDYFILPPGTERLAIRTMAQCMALGALLRCGCKVYG